MTASPLIPIALVASLGGLFYVDKQCKKLQGDTDKTGLEKKKKLRLGLAGFAVVLCLVMIYDKINHSRARSSFESRVAKAASSLRSSLGSSSSCMSGRPRSSMNYSGVPKSSNDFSARVSEAAADLRRQIAQTPVQTPRSSSALAAKASAEISQFIANNS